MRDWLAGESPPREAADTSLGVRPLQGRLAGHPPAAGDWLLMTRNPQVQQHAMEHARRHSFRPAGTGDRTEVRVEAMEPPTESAPQRPRRPHHVPHPLDTGHTQPTAGAAPQHQPTAATPSAPPPGRSEADDAGDDDAIITGSSGPPAAALLPHARQNCWTHTFRDATQRTKDDAGGTEHEGSNRSHCAACWCAICEIPAGDCTNWALHCDADKRLIGTPHARRDCQTHGLPTHFKEDAMTSLRSCPDCYCVICDHRPDRCIDWKKHHTRRLDERSHHTHELRAALRLALVRNSGLHPDHKANNLTDKQRDDARSGNCPERTRPRTDRTLAAVGRVYRTADRDAAPTTSTQTPSATSSASGSET